MSERRRHQRFNLAETGSEVSLSEPSPEDLLSCKLVNLSQGGMCFEGPRAFREGSVKDFQILLKEVLDDLISVKARIQWCEFVETARWRHGAEFLSSDRAYLGPERED